MLRCKTCNEVRSNEYFYGTGRNEKIYYVTRKCKICRGVKVRDKFSHKPKRVKGDYDKRLLYLFLLRMELNIKNHPNENNATRKDIMKLEISYTQIYGDSMPEFVDRSDGLVFMYEKLKEFDVDSKSSGGGGQIKRKYNKSNRIVKEKEVVVKEVKVKYKQTKPKVDKTIPKLKLTKEIVLNALNECNGNKTITSMLLNISPITLNKKMNEYDLNNLFKVIVGNGGIKYSDEEKELILNTLNECNWNLSKTARIFNVSITKIYNRIKFYNLR